MRTAPCSICGRPRALTKGSAPIVICHECRRDGHGRRTTCKHCAARFIKPAGQTTRRYCDNCTALQVFSPPVTRTCKHCGDDFPAKGARQRQHCADCTAKAVWITGDRRLVPCGGLNIRQRVAKFGVEHERVVKRTVYVRDAWTCGICRQPVDPTLAYPHQMSASLDHVIPISMGGGHTYANTQCAHLFCNVRKGAGCAEGGEQLALA